MPYIAPTAHVSFHDNIYDDARVEDRAIINHNGILLDSSKAYCNAQVLSNDILKTIILKDNCHVFGNAIIDISHFTGNLKLILGEGCKVGGRFDMRQFKTVEELVAEYPNNSELKTIEENRDEDQFGFIDYDDDRHGYGRDIRIDYDGVLSPYRVLSVTLTNIWLMG